MSVKPFDTKCHTTGE